MDLYISNIINSLGINDKSINVSIDIKLTDKLTNNIIHTNKYKYDYYDIFDLPEEIIIYIFSFNICNKLDLFNFIRCNKDLTTTYSDLFWRTLWNTYFPKVNKTLKLLKYPLEPYCINEEDSYKQNTLKGIDLQWLSDKNYILFTRGNYYNANKYRFIRWLNFSMLTDKKKIGTIRIVKQDNNLNRYYYLDCRIYYVYTKYHKSSISNLYYLIKYIPVNKLTNGYMLYIINKLDKLNKKIYSNDVILNNLDHLLFYLNHTKTFKYASICLNTILKYISLKLSPTYTNNRNKILDLNIQDNIKLYMLVNLDMINQTNNYKYYIDKLKIESIENYLLNIKDMLFNMPKSSPKYMINYFPYILESYLTMTDNPKPHIVLHLASYVPVYILYMYDIPPQYYPNWYIGSKFIHYCNNNIDINDLKISKEITGNITQNKYKNNHIWKELINNVLKKANFINTMDYDNLIESPIYSNIGKILNNTYLSYNIINSTLTFDRQYKELWCFILSYKFKDDIMKNIYGDGNFIRYKYKISKSIITYLYEYIFTDDEKLYILDNIQPNNINNDNIDEVRKYIIKCELSLYSKHVII